jgi:nicotinamide phosphoribosyltransferase
VHNMFPLHATDFYKTGHYAQYPAGTEYVYSNFTCRSDKFFKGLPDFDHKVVFFGLQAVCKWLLIEQWNKEFFNKPKDEVVSRYKRRMDKALGPGLVDTKHIEDLHDLGYLPVEIKALAEGARVNIRVPLYTIRNTDPNFGWVTNYLETQLSAETWKPITTATMAYEYRRLLDRYAELTGSSKDFVPWQGHDFSDRGMSGIYDGAINGAAHLLSFTGTDTVQALDFLEDYYGASDTFIGGSVPATEHSVMCMGGKEDEVETFRRLITKTYPKGIVSIVSDTWDFWKVVTDYVQQLKYVILSRDGKVVIRPDSGDPVDILCGTAYISDLDKEPSVKSLEDAKSYAEEWLVEDERDATPHGECGNWEISGYFKFNNKIYKIVVQIDWNRHDKQYYYIDGSSIKSCVETVLTPSEKGAVECLWEVFGGTITDKGYKLLDSHIGLIYGDSITLDRAQAILARLKQKGFASGNIILGIGSYTFNYVTRDTLGSAIKATWGVVNGEERNLFKDPVTDSGVKKSAKGLLMVTKEGNEYVLHDEQTKSMEATGQLKTVFWNSQMMREQSLEEIRKELHG